MYKKQNLPSPVIRFTHFVNKPYAVFNTLHKEVTIGVLAVSTLTFANHGVVSAQTELPSVKNVHEMDGIEVIGSRVPLTQTEVARIVTVLDRKTIENAPVQSVNDLLKYAAGIDVRQRGAMGIQTDISIRGGTFDQITVLLNGVNISNPQTGHLTADFPVGRARMRLAYLCDLQQSHVNDIKTHAYSHVFMVGFVKEFYLLGNKKK